MPVPEFVVRLRDRIGHDPLWLPGATGIVFDGERVLLTRRSDSGAWSPVSGICEPGEHPADTIVREALEETGVTCVVEGLAWVNVTPERTYPNGDRTRYLDHTFRCRYVSGEARVADDESTDVGWFGPDDLPELSGEDMRRITLAREYAGHTVLGDAVPTTSTGGAAVRALVDRASEEFTGVVRRLPPDVWDRPTPSQVSVRELVDHVVAGNLFTALLLAGVPRDEARVALAGDHLGDNPLTAVIESSARQAGAFAAVPAERPVPHPSGDVTVERFRLFRLIDLVVHGWDVLRAAGLDETLDPELVEAVWGLVEPALPELLPLRAYGDGPSGTLTTQAPTQARLLDALGRRP